jgi:hypothetical protein
MKIIRNCWLIAVRVVGSGAAGLISVANAQSGNDLWVERNSYYKDAGYRFKTARAIAYFGNAGCQYDNEAALPLSRGVRARIAEIVRLEAQYGCS